MKAEETDLKCQLSELNKEYDKLDARVGLLGHKSLLDDYSKTLKHLDSVRKGIGSMSINDDPIKFGEDSEEGEDPITRTEEKKWSDRGRRIESRRQDSGASSGGGIGSGESEISSPNERDNESSN